MDAMMIAMLSAYGLNAVLEIVQAWKASGEPTEEEIKALYITMKPEDYFPPSPDDK